jgi:O-antigen ligase
MKIQQFILNFLFFCLLIFAFTLDAIKGFSILTCIIATLYLLIYLFYNRRVIFFKDLVLPLFFCLFNLASISWGGDVFSALSVISAILIGCVVSLGLRTVISFSIVWWGVLLSAIINILFAYMNFNFLPDTNEIRIGGLLDNANALAIFLALGAFVLYFLSVKRTLTIKIIVFSILAFVLFYTGSRKGLLLIGLIGAFIFIDYIKEVNIKAKYCKIWLILFISFFILIVFSPIIVEKFRDIVAIQRMQDMLNGSDRWSVPGRLAMINRGLVLWGQNPLLGLGAGGFTLDSGFHTYSHNNYIELLANYGLIGFFIYYAYYVYLFYCGWRLRKWYLPRAGMVIVGMLFILEFGLVSLANKTSWIFLGLATACIFSRHGISIEK